MRWYLGPLKKYAAFNGRARRLEFFTFTLVNFAIYVAFVVANMSSSIDWLGTIVLIYALAVFLPTLALTVRRLHDTGRSGAWYFIGFVPFVGGLWLLALMLMAGESGDNVYGPDPKGAAA